MFRPRFFLVLVASVVCGCGGSQRAAPAPSAAAQAQAQAQAKTKAAPAVPLFPGTGAHERRITTSSAEAAHYFNQGLNFLYGFNHDEAIRSFKQAAALDPGCAMAAWGVSVAYGPHINNPSMPPERAKAAWAALEQARALAERASPVERALITALSQRYADPQPADRKPLDQAYAAAMRLVHRDYPDDADVAALFAESLMDLRPWDLWTQDGKPQPGTPEIVAVLERTLSQAPAHPLALHLYIHAVEASPTPERADAAADRLRDLMPGIGHMVHMPSHIDVRRGRWQQAATANEKAIEADRRYRALSPRQDFYRVYMAHNLHMLAYAAMMQGQGERALRAVREMVAGIPADWLQANAAIADGFTAMSLEVLMRFGRWEEVLAEPDFPSYLPIARAMRHVARGVAYTARGDLEGARAEQRAFAEARAKVPAGAFFGNNSAADLLAVAGHLLDGEILFRSGRTGPALAALREAVRREDGLRYDEPPDWIHPVRHVLGAVLLKAGRPAEAEVVYREDLRRLPDNGWSLYGLGRSLRAQKSAAKAAEAARVEARFNQIWGAADVKLASSCLCQD
jgi:tetratricopeptide (TPR) repeat protein